MKPFSSSLHPASGPHRAIVCGSLLLLGCLPLLTAAPRSSASYSIGLDTLNAGGRANASASARYAQQGSVGGLVGVSRVASPATEARHGYAGQIFDVVTLAVSAEPTTLNEGATRQLVATARLDDQTALNVRANSVSWSVVDGPILGINAGGVATAGVVYQDTLAAVRGSFLGAVGNLNLLVRNVGEDDFGTYAGDGLNDAWQVQHFGLNNPNAGPGSDPDADGQNNRYEEYVGTNPVDNNSLFRLRIESIPGRPGQKNLIFSPRVPGRSYAVEWKDSLNAGPFAPLVPSAISDAGPERTVTDLGATETNKFYRVRITQP